MSTTAWMAGLSAALLLTGAALIVLWLQVRGLRRALALRDAAIGGVKNDVAALCAGAVGVGERQTRLEQRFEQLRTRQQEIELQEPEARPYAQAIRLVQNGAQVEDVISACGLTRSEAELVVMLHRMDEAG
jgi:hypothetical protein